MTIEGIPCGWELVRIGKPFINERYISLSGKVTNCVCIPSGEAYAIVRKIEKPKKYRPFENAAEADCLWNAVLKLVNPANGSEDSRYRINSITRDGATIGLQFLDYRKAFEMFSCIDGTPFGIEVTE